MSKFKEVTGIPALDFSLHLIANEIAEPEEVYASMADAAEGDVITGQAREQHLFAMGYVLSIMHFKQMLAQKSDVN